MSAFWALASIGDLAKAFGRDGPLQPTHLGTEGLEAALTAWRATEAEDGPSLAPGPTLAPGDRSARVQRLRARLATLGWKPLQESVDSSQFDAPLREAVLGFQLAHGLEPDGRVGPATQAELDRSPRDRARQIAESIAERRALPRDLGRRFLLLNLSAFTLEAIADGIAELSSRVVIGQPKQPTPTLVSTVRSVVAHPAWNVPDRIARREIAPRIERDPGYLERLGFELFSASAGSRPIDPGGFDWTAFRRGELAVRLRQRPGPLNALGAVSIRFPNPHNICLHDTPERDLFARARRDLSHGCVRVERAVELARWLMTGEGLDIRQDLDKALAAGATVELPLPYPVPIYVVDWSAWIDARGVLQLRPEVYPPDSRSTP